VTLITVSDKKRKKKKRKLEALIASAEAEHRAAADASPAAPGSPPQPTLGKRVLDWLDPVSRTLDADRSLAAAQASVLIAVNCVMLSLAAHALLGGVPGAALGPALLALALTNLVSLAFAIFSARAPEQPTSLDALWATPDAEFEPALQLLAQSKQSVSAALAREVHEQGAALTRAKKHLRVAYHVLLAGVALSAVVFTLCLAVGSSI